MQINLNINIDDRIIHFIKRTITKRNCIIGGMMIVLFAGFITLMAQSLTWTDFQSGDPISASAMNTRFNSIRDSIYDLSDNINDLSERTVPAGTIMPFAGPSSNIPQGWFLCNGATKSRTSYSKLFAAITTTWGAGDNSTTFNLPDLRAAFLRGAGTQDSNNLSPVHYRMANESRYVAPSVGQFEIDQFQGHYHRFSEAVRDGGSNSKNSAKITTGTDRAKIFEPIAGGYGDPRYGDETRPFAASVLYIIKY